MATDVDPKTFKSWEDAFAYPILTVRKFDRQIQDEINANKERLRTLVGTSYRDLLGTAERIVEMDGQMRGIESALVQTGRKCNVQSIHKLEENYDKWISGVTAKEKSDYTLASQLAVLQACPRVLSRLLRHDSSVLLAAKVIVIARLAHKALSTRSDVPSLADKLRDQIARLRGKLLRRIDQIFAKPNISAPSLIGAMCAFSSATSSSAKDVLRHFHEARLAAIRGMFDSEDALPRENIVEALKLFTRTLSDTPAVASSRLSDALARLKLHPLLSDSQIREIEDFNLDVHAKWLGDDLQNFIPWIRHDDLKQSDANSQLQIWARHGIMAILDGLKMTLGQVQDVQQLVSLRKQILTQWFEGRRLARKSTVSTPDALNDIRSIINNQFTSLADQKAGRLQLVAEEIKLTLKNWEAGVTDRNESLWDPSISLIDTSNGAEAFKSALVDRSQGHNAPLHRLLSIHTSWKDSISDAHSAIATMRSTKWDEDDLLDSDSETDDSKSDSDPDSSSPSARKSLPVLLSSTDPTLLSSALTGTLTKCFAALKKALAPLPSSLDPSTPQKAIYLLRVYRLLASTPSPAPDISPAFLEPRPLYTLLTKSFPLVTPLHTLQKTITSQILNRRTPARVLWEGAPVETPVLPSPCVFRLLAGVVEGMEVLGADVWGSQDGVVILKSSIVTKISEGLSQIDMHSQVDAKAEIKTKSADKKSSSTEDLNEDTDDQDPGPAKAVEPAEPKSEEYKLQILFDIFLLRRIFGGDWTEPIHKLELQQQQQSQSEDDASVKGTREVSQQTLDRLERLAGEYWTRTKLLFGLLGS